MPKEKQNNKKISPVKQAAKTHKEIDGYNYDQFNEFIKELRRKVRQTAFVSLHHD
ncbi:MAG: hypothetical protein RR571_08900 [Anaerorhabdus sp.]